MPGGAVLDMVIFCMVFNVRNRNFKVLNGYSFGIESQKKVVDILKEEHIE